MATRRGLGYTSPPTPMTPKGGSGMMYDNADTSNPMMMPYESPDQFRRRTTPVAEMPKPRQSAIEDLLAMLTEGR